ncbi:hypothetical protein BH11BAC4_BH11BAC4_05040 [soil metagenome]
MESKRKKWTPNEEITDALLKFREKRKWQLAFRRYILERNTSQFYAPYFGLDIEKYRKWIELQFNEGLNWDNFGTAWQFDHLVPVAYFDFSKEEDLFLCWNFINIRVEKLELNKSKGNRIDVLAVKPYFQALFDKTQNAICKRMIEKIGEIEVANVVSEPALEDFLINQKTQLEQLASLSVEEFARLNKGTSLKDIFLEREILRKFG